IALLAVLALGILHGILLAALASAAMLLVTASRPHAAFLGQIPGTSSYSDMARHPENQALPGVIAFRPEASVLYINSDAVLEAVIQRLRAQEASDVHLVICDLLSSPDIDLSVSRMLHALHGALMD